MYIGLDPNLQNSFDTDFLWLLDQGLKQTTRSWGGNLKHRNKKSSMVESYCFPPFNQLCSKAT